MKLTWLGHACFLLETDSGSVVFDPYAPGSVPGVELPPLEADIVLCSHGHQDHSYEAGVHLSGNQPVFTVERISCYHDNAKGLVRGKNQISIIHADGMRAAHLGDLGHMLRTAELEKLKGVDLLMIPVGGFFTIDGDTAAELVKAIQPKVVVPMHYKGENFGYGVIGTVDKFAGQFKDTIYADTNTLEITSETEAMTVVLRCPTNQ